MQPLDVVFTPSGDWSLDALTLEVLLASPRPLGRVLLATTAAIDVRLSRSLDSARVRWDHLVGKHETEALNRSLLISSNDVLLVGQGSLPSRSMISALLAALDEEDRAAAIIPMIDETGVSEAALTTFLETTRLPLRERVPVADTTVALLRRTVLEMAGALDEHLADAREALAEWCLRAQRLGFVVFREPRAWASRSRSVPRSPMPTAQTLVERHPYYETQRQVANENVQEEAVKRTLRAQAFRPVIGLDLRYLPEGAINGTSVYAVELIKAIRANSPAQMTICVATEGQRAALSPLGLPITLNTFSPDVTLVHRPAQVFRPQDLALLLKTPAPYLLSFQDLIAYRAGSAFAGRGEEQLRYQQCSWVAVRSAQGLLAISHHNRREVVREFGVDEDSIHVVHHGVDTAAFARREGEEAAESAVLAKLKLPRRFFLFVGSDYAHKNVQLLLTAYATFRSRVPPTEEMPGLVLVGHPSGTQHALFPRLREQPLVGVHYLGSVSHEELRALYHRATAFLYLSAYEGFGLPLLEAMASGAPVLCSRFSSIPEVAGDACLSTDDMSDSGIADRMVDLVRDSTLRERLVRAGLERVTRFTWAKTAEATLAVYEKIARAPSRQSFVERQWLSRLIQRPLVP